VAPHNKNGPRLDAGQFLFTSVLVCKHDRQHSIDDGFSIFALDSWLFIQIDLPEDRFARVLKAAEIVLPVRIVVRREIGEGTHALQDVGNV
jgi:hypothetical protein